MRRAALFVLILYTSVCVFTSCGEVPDAYAMMCDFARDFGISGAIYSPSVPEGEDGYTTPDLISRIYLTGEVIPSDYAVILNCRADYGAECGVFVCDSEAECTAAIEMCEERLRILSRGDGNALLIRSGNTVFYSTLTDHERAEHLWRKIVASHT